MLVDLDGPESFDPFHQRQFGEAVGVIQFAKDVRIGLPGSDWSRHVDDETSICRFCLGQKLVEFLKVVGDLNERIVGLKLFRSGPDGDG